MLYINARQKQMLTQQQRNNRRKRATPRQLAFLRKVFAENPKPNQKTREQIGRYIDMTPRSVQIWFQNNRAKTRIQEKRLASIYSVPVTTSTYGNNISRVHVDMKALYNQRLNGYNPEYSSSSPILASSGSSPYSTGDDEDSLIESSLFESRSKQADYPYNSITTPQSASDAQLMPAIMYQKHQYEDGLEFLGNETNSFDIGKILDDCSSEDDHYGLTTTAPPFYSTAAGNSSSGNGGNNTVPWLEDAPPASADPPYRSNRKFNVWSVKIRSWVYNAEDNCPIYLEISKATQKAMIIMYSAPDLPMNPDYNQDGESPMIIEFQLRSVSKLSNSYAKLEIDTPPTFCTVSSTGDLVPTDIDFTQGEAFCTNECLLYGQFEYLDIGSQDTITPNPLANYNYNHARQVPVKHTRTYKDSLEELLMDG